MTHRVHPLAMLKGLDDASHVKMRIYQYEAFKGWKGLETAKAFVKVKITS